MGDPEVDALLEGQIVAVPLRDEDEVTLRDTVPETVDEGDGDEISMLVPVDETEGHTVDVSDTLTVGVAEADRQSVADPEGQDVADGHTV